MRNVLQIQSELGVSVLLKKHLPPKNKENSVIVVIVLEWTNNGKLIKWLHTARLEASAPSEVVGRARPAVGGVNVVFSTRFEIWDQLLSHHSLVRKQFSIYPKCSSLTIAGQRSCSSSSWETWPRNQQRKSCRSTTYKVRMPSNKWDKKKNNCLRVTDHIPVFIIRFSVQTDWIQTKQIKQSFRLILTEWKSAFTLSQGGIRI